MARFWPRFARVICDDREDPEQSPCILDPGHETDHEDEYGERWSQQTGEEP